MTESPEEVFVDCVDRSVKMSRMECVQLRVCPGDVLM